MLFYPHLSSKIMKYFSLEHDILFFKQLFLRIVDFVQIKQRFSLLNFFLLKLTRLNVGGNNLVQNNFRSNVSWLGFLCVSCVFVP